MFYYQLALSLIFFTYGICIGSFLITCIKRIPEQRSVLTGRSCCPHCCRKLAAGEMIPIFSWLFAKGRCRHCRTALSRTVPLLEGLTGLLFVLCFLTFGFTPAAAIHCLFAAALLIGAVIDCQYHYIPDRISISIIILALLQMPGGQGPSLSDALAGSLAVSGFMLVISLATGGGIGLGDIKLLAATGLFLGLKGNILAFFLGYLLAAAFCLPRVLKGALSRGSEIPMVPFFTAAIVISALWGSRLITVYLSLFY